MFCIHILGDTPSPFAVGYLSDYMAAGTTDPAKLADALRSAMMLCVVTTALAGIIFVGVIPFLRRTPNEPSGLVPQTVSN
jgi:predicted exporter